MILNNRGTPIQPTGRIQVPGVPIDNRSEAEKLADFDFLVLPDMSFAMVHKRTGIQILMRSDNTFGIRDVFGSSIQTRTDGTLIIDAKKIVLMTEEADGLVQAVRAAPPETPPSTPET